jgi:hypothetical protein
MKRMAAGPGTICACRAPAALLRVSSLLFITVLVSCGVGGNDAGTRPGGFAAVAPAPELVRQPLAGEAVLTSLKPGRAVLVEGSSPVKGLPGFGRNALSALTGAYALVPADGSGQHKVAVWFTREILVKPGDWKKPHCRSPATGFTVLTAPAEPDGSSLWSISNDEFTLLARMPAGLPDPCAFMAVFAERFSFFYRYAGRPEDVSFPAILEL